MLCAYSFTIKYIKIENRASSRLLIKNRVSLKNRASSRLLAQKRVSQVFWDPIKNRVSLRSVLLKAVYLEALLYSHYPLNPNAKSSDAKRITLTQMILHSEWEGNDFIWKLRCHCIQIMYSDIYSVAMTRFNLSIIWVSLCRLFP